MTSELYPRHSAKIKSVDELSVIVREARQAGKKTALAIGSFNILMYHHARYLAEAAEMADMLVVLTNSDESLKAYKNRSGTYVAIPEAERMGLLASFACVDYVAAFGHLHADQAIASIHPDIMARGGDYTLETLHPPERALCERLGIEIRFTPLRHYTNTGRFVREIIEKGR
ncbi:MAG: hypothetical protein WC728_08390 [Elusimicrobiota bacterium]